MSNGEVCCILGVCCPPAAAREKLSVEIEKVAGCDAETSRKCADWLLDTFDFAPKGSLDQFKVDIARMAKHHHE